jgi:hypothetical protein
VLFVRKKRHVNRHKITKKGIVMRHLNSHELRMHDLLAFINKINAQK